MARAAYYERNRVIRVGEAEVQPPGPGEVQIQVAYAGICGTDLHIYHGRMDWRVAPSQIMGHEASGVVSAVGEGVESVREGQRVTVMPLKPCGTCPACRAGHSHICMNLKFIGIDTPGAFQSAWVVPEYAVLPLPERVPLKRAALIEPLAVACHDVRLGEVAAGESVVVIGGGPIGTLIGLVAQHDGARVLVSEINPSRVAIAHTLGLEAVNPLEVDLVTLVEERTGSAGADVVFEASGSAEAAAGLLAPLRPGGTLVYIGMPPAPVKLDIVSAQAKEIRMETVFRYANVYPRALQLMGSGRLDVKPLITDRFPFVESVEAFDYARDLPADSVKVQILLD